MSWKEVTTNNDIDNISKTFTITMTTAAAAAAAVAEEAGDTSASESRLQQFIMPMISASQRRSG